MTGPKLNPRDVAELKAFIKRFGVHIHRISRGSNGTAAWHLIFEEKKLASHSRLCSDPERCIRVRATVPKEEG